MHAFKLHAGKFDTIWKYLDSLETVQNFLKLSGNIWAVWTVEVVLKISRNIQTVLKLSRRY